MPKIVDHAKQKIKVAEATWRLILKEGIEAASVRKIADEAGISPGSMRHYFSTQSELFAYSMELVSDRVKSNIQSITFTGDILQDVQTLLFELLPLDKNKSAEMEVWLIFNVKALSDPLLKPLSEKVYGEMRFAISKIIDSLIHEGAVNNSQNRDEEIIRLHTLIDGLALHMIIQPKHMTPEIAQEIVLHHLKSICTN